MLLTITNNVLFLRCEKEQRTITKIKRNEKI